MRTIIKLRAQTAAFVYGDFEDLDPDDAHVFAYTRTLGNEKYLVVDNFSSSPVEYTLPKGLKAATLLLCDIPSSQEANVSTLKLAPWESNLQAIGGCSRRRRIFNVCVSRGVLAQVYQI